MYGCGELVVGVVVEVGGSSFVVVVVVMKILVLFKLFCFYS
jgi:hypothetical protein